MNLRKIVRRAGPVLLSLSVVAICLSTCSVVWSQQPPPPPPLRGHPGPPRLDRAGVSDHIEGVRRQLAQSRTNDPDDEILVAAARRVLAKAEEKLRANEVIVADRLVAASDAFLHATERSRRFEEGPRSRLPQPTEIAGHLQHVYFHLQQADYFERTTGDDDAKQLPGLARKFYESSLQAYDKNDWFGADAFAKSADDTIRGLENLAQAATPLPPRPR
jgi:hypothetical protein